MPKPLIAVIAIVVVIVVVSIVRAIFGGSSRGPSKNVRFAAFIGLRDLVFCDAPVSALVEQRSGPPRSEQVAEALEQKHFGRAVKLLEEAAPSGHTPEASSYYIELACAKTLAGDRQGATEAALKVTGDETVEARMRITAWSILRENGHKPSDSDSSKVLGVVVETRVFDSTALVAGFADGDARLLVSSGFAILGDYTQFPRVVEASSALVAEAEKMLPTMPVETSRPLPEKGRIRFYALTPAGMHVIEDSEREVGRRGHQLYPFYSCMQNLLTSIRTGPARSAK